MLIFLMGTEFRVANRRVETAPNCAYSKIHTCCPATVELVYKPCLGLARGSSFTIQRCPRRHPLAAKAGLIWISALGKTLPHEHSALGTVIPGLGREMLTSSWVAWLCRIVLHADLALSHFLAGRSWARPVTSLCAPVSSSLKPGNDRTSIRWLVWDYGSPCVKVLSRVVVMIANEIPG